MLRRLDAVKLAQVQVSRGRWHVLILPLDRHPRWERTITANFSASNVRPMQIGEILDGTFNLYRRHFGLLMRLSFTLICLPAVIGVYLLARFASDPMGFSAWVGEHIGATIGYGLLALIVFAVISVLLKSGTVKIISDSYLGHEPALRDALQFGAGRIVPMLLVALSKGLLIILLYFAEILVFLLFAGLARAVGGTLLTVWVGVFGIIGGVWFLAFVLCGYALTTMVVVLEDLDSSFNAFGRSWDLTRGAKLKVFVVWLVMWLLTYFVPGLAQLGVSAAIGPNVALQVTVAILSPVVSVALAPLPACALTLVYYDLRVRREAFDLEILSEQLETR
ncbi:MAG: hypothetical protein ACREMI_04890 [Gemmatimonadales bacterium]